MLSAFYRIQGKYKEAEPLYLQTIAISVAAFHPVGAGLLEAWLAFLQKCLHTFLCVGYLGGSSHDFLRIVVCL